MAPLVSIITPCHNAGEYIAQTIESVLMQKYRNWEMLIVDDCSTDNSADIIKDYASKDSRIKYFKTQKASGSPSLPRNIAIDNAEGEYIAFLDSDDIWYPEKLECQVGFAIENGYHFVYADYEKMDYEGHQNDRFIRMPIKSTFWDVLETCTIPCLTVLLSREIIGRTRFRDIPKEDFVFWLDILKKGVAARNCGKVLASYRVMKSSRSSNKFAMIKNQWYVLRKIEGVKIPIASYFMAKFLFYGFRKYLK